MSDKRKVKILVAMSGGVDSSVVAALLMRQGYDVTGAYMINYEDVERGRGKGEGGASCWTSDYRDAVRVAARLGIRLVKLDFTKEYKKFVLDYMYREYEAGRTPNPDVLCNKFVKFGAWLKKARELGFDMMVTGHYARLWREFPVSPPAGGRPKGDNFQFPNKSPIQNLKLAQAKDGDKDQTYFLHQLSQEQLRHVLFPVGDYTKKQVRAMARKWTLPTAEKEESMGICFIGEVPMKEFLMKKIKPKPGDVVLSDGVGANGRSPLPSNRRPVVGRHEGLAFYTIGQRIGLSSLQRHSPEKGNPGRPMNDLDPRLHGDDKVKQDSLPYYVVAKDLHTNTLIVGHDNDPMLYKKEIEVMDINWIAGRQPKFPLQCEVRLRHRQPLQKCIIASKTRLQALLSEKGRGVLVRFAHPQRAVTPGQFAVFYKNRECLGGGVIK